MSAPSSAADSSSHGVSKRPLDPITRNALRYTISPKEYELLHQYLISRAPQNVQRSTPNPPRYEKMTRNKTETADYNVASFRAALRLFVVAYTGLKAWEQVSLRLARRSMGPE